MRCPFPDCQGNAGSCELLSDGVYRCRQCGRLVAQCVSAECLALNRPFARYCRQCRRFQGTHSSLSPGRERWDAFAHFDDHWRFSTANSQPAADLVADLQEQVHGYITSERLMAFALIDGVLAIHQSGGFVALAHPFGEKAEGRAPQAVFWSVPESDWIRNSATTVAPYRPVATADRRYLLFSSARGCLAVDLFSMPGWSAREDATSFTVMGDAELQERRLAAAPVPLDALPAAGEPPTINRCGMLVVESEASNPEYRWQVWNVTDRRHESRPVVDVALPIRGVPAQVLIADQTAIVFATPDGHWWWMWADALRGNTQALHRSWPPKDMVDGELCLDRELEAEMTGARVYRWQMQYLVSFAAASVQSSGPSPLELCYARRRGKHAGQLAEFYQINVARQKWDYPTELTTTGHLLPIGEDHGDLLFLGNTHENRNAMLWRKTQGDNRAAPRQGIIADKILDVVGVQMQGPLLMMICPDPSDPARLVQVRAVTIRSDPHYSMAEIPQLQLQADPVSCAEYLFTIERHGGRVRLIRRRLPIVHLTT